MKNVVVLGAGSFGTALAAVVAERGLNVSLWGRDPEVVRGINEHHRNDNYLSDIELPERIKATTDLACCEDADLLIVAIPSKFFRQVCEDAAQYGIPPHCVTLSATKGIELSSGKRMTELLREIFPENVAAVVSGPSHAEELARKLPTALVVGCADEAIAKQLQGLLTQPFLRSYTSNDVVGIEFGGTVKNIAAIAGGIVEGLGLGDNAKAALVTRGLAEMVRLGVAKGANPETFMGLSGVGDLMVTCFSDYSRNTRVGRLLGKGSSLAEIQSQTNMIAEGVPNTESVYQFAQKNGIRAPITEMLHAVLNNQVSPKDAAQQLFARSPRSETD
tara:strand:+ start:4462 stop:5457 length:996 start_codon:yes stop_codon:yes gene_type:complete